MKNSCQKYFAIILIMFTIFTFIPLTANADSGGISSTPTSIMPQITITPKFNGGKSEGSTTNSYVNSVVLNASNKPASGSFIGADLEAKVLDGAGKKLVGYTAYFIKFDNRILLTDEKPQKTEVEKAGGLGKSFSSESSSKISFDATNNGGSLSSQMHYFGLFVYDKDGNFVAKTLSSIYVSYFHEATSSVRWERQGMQIRMIDDIPIGKYVYLRGEYASETTPNNNALCNVPYFYLKWSFSGEVGFGQTIGIENIDELYQWLAEYVAEPYKEIKGKELSGSVEIGGPAVVIGKNNSQGNILYIDAYYKSSAKTVTGEGPGAYPSIGMTQTGKSNKDWTQNVNTYADWGNNTKKDFLEAAFTRTSIEVKPKSNVRVVCYDEDKFLANPSVKPIHEYTIDLPEMVQTSSIDDLGKLSNNLLRHYSDSFLNSWTTDKLNSLGASKMSDYMYANIGKLIELYSTVSYDETSKKLVSKKTSEVLNTAIGMYDVRKEAIEAAKADAKISPYVGTATIDPVPIAGYEFDFGFGLDMLTSDSLHLGAAVSSAAAPGKQALNVIYCSTNGEKTVYLFYKGTPGRYTVKYCINGTIDESMTEEYPASIGDIIKEGDFPIKPLPEGVNVTDIENVPLTISDDPEANVIIVNAGQSVPYVVEYYKKTELFKTENKIGEYGDYAEADFTPPSGYEFDHVDNYPLQLIKPNQVVRVYFEPSNNIKTPAVGVSNLYSDDGYSAKAVIGSIKSGYGVYGMFTIDYSQFYTGNNITTSYHTPPPASSADGCRSSWGTQQQPQYRNIKITAKATFTDYYYNGKPVEKGRERTVNMVVKGTTNTTYSAKQSESKHSVSFVFPKNNIGNGLGLQKAYIPVGWKDKTNWTVNFSATISYEEISWRDISHTGSHRYYCNGCRRSKDGESYCPGHTCRYCWYSCDFSYKPYSKSISSSASVYVNGSMYEDDFTGRGRR